MQFPSAWSSEKFLCWLSVFSCCVSIAQGRYLQRGSRLVDFDIRLGDSVCVPVSLTDNQVDCRPPTERPNMVINDTLCHGDTLSLQVNQLYSRHLYTSVAVR